MLVLKREGLYCPAGDFYIDPSRGVEHAVVTHAHADHARRGSQMYYCVNSGVDLLRARLGRNLPITAYAYGQIFERGPVKISFHPAGHILGSCQVRLEHAGEVWVVSGDYKREPDPTCEAFEVVPCDVFVTEATFGTPSYNWKKDSNVNTSTTVATQIMDWWNHNRSRGDNSVLFGYSLGKTQRILGLLSGLAPEPIYCHPAAAALNAAYLRQCVSLADTICLSEVGDDQVLSGALVIAPQAFLKTDRVKVLGGRFKTAFASGWMARGAWGFDKGFLLSDHADWNDLVQTVLQTGAKTVYVQHRGQGALVKHLRGLGLKAYSDSELEVQNPDQMALF